MYICPSCGKVLTLDIQQHVPGVLSPVYKGMDELILVVAPDLGTKVFIRLQFDYSKNSLVLAKEGCI